MAFELKNLIIGGLLAGFFIFVMISGGVYLSEANNSTSPLLSDSSINRTFSELGGNLSGAKGVSEDAREGFEQEIPTIGTDSFLFSSIISTGKVLTSTFSNIMNSLLLPVRIVFGLDDTPEGRNAGSVIFGTVMAIITVLIVFLSWRSFKTGA